MLTRTCLRATLCTAILLTVAGCGAPPSDAAFSGRGNPESLLDISSEIVSLGTADASEIAGLSDWVARDRPSRAELNCSPVEKYCAQAKKILQTQHVALSAGNGNTQSVTLIYERVIARDCNPRFVDNTQDQYNTNHPAFGCAVSANMVQHVTDKQEFINPTMLDVPSATRAVNDLRRASVPRPPVAPYNLDDSLVSRSSSGSQ